MAIVRWNPWTMSQLLDDNAFDDGWSNTMPVNLSEDADTVYVDLMLPGFNEDDIKITIEGSTLTIRAESQKETEDTNKKYYRKEIRAQSVVRSITLPSTVNSSKTSAEFSNGILKLSLSKAEEAKPKEISIKDITK